MAKYFELNVSMHSLKLILKLASSLPSFPNTSTLAHFLSTYWLSLRNAILSCNLMIGRVFRASDWPKTTEDTNILHVSAYKPTIRV